MPLPASVLVLFLLLNVYDLCSRTGWDRRIAAAGECPAAASCTLFEHLHDLHFAHLIEVIRMLICPAIKPNRSIINIFTAVQNKLIFDLIRDNIAVLG